MTLLRRYGDVIACLLLLLVFLQWPQIDLQIARLFWRADGGFWLRDLWWVQLLYKVFAKAWILAAVWGLLLALSWLPRWRAALAPRRRALLFLLFTLLIGPGLIVHGVFKDHWGRARPVHLLEFGGQARFTAAGVISDQCHRNCSFVSGHVASGFYLMAFYWVTRRRRWLAAGIGLGLLLSAVRIIMGAHFLSDAVFAGFVVHFTLRLAARWLLPAPAQPALPPPAAR